MNSFKKHFAFTSPDLRSLPAFLSLGFVALILFGATARGVLSEDLVGAALEETYILDSDEGDGDPAINRHTVRTTFEAEISITFPDGPYNGTYRVAYSLRNSSGGYEFLLNGDLSHPTLPKRIAYTDPQSVALTSFALFPNSPTPSQTLDFEAQPDPLNTLGTKESYYVEGTLQRRTSANGVVPEVWEDVENGGIVEMDSTAPVQLLHFTNTVSGDDEYNVRAGISNVSWDRTHALATDATGDAFEATVDYFANRWDDFNAAPFHQIVTFQADFDLIDSSTNASIPLENDGISEFTLGLWNHSFGLAQPQARESGSETVMLKPLQQIESAAKTYILRCTLSHLEDPIDTVYQDSSCDLTPQVLYHFNGNLKFGSLLTQFKAMSNTPTTLAGSTVNFRNTWLRIPVDQGVVPNRPGYSFGNNAALTVRLLNNGDAELYG
ncbi:hypothetical protein N9A94_09270, partial [Akkermansiaceae bacterium]|nr:hypothetical protein [Akkermansiaceae bacterium]